MAKPFKIEMISDVAEVIAANQKVETSLEDVADALDAVGDDGAALEAKLSEAMSGTGAAAKKAGSDLEDGLGAGAANATSRVEDELSTLPGTAGDLGKSAGDLLAGNLEGAADGIGEKISGALGGIGPAGVAAGALAALGLKAIFAELEASEKKAAETKARVIDLAEALGEVEGNPAALEWADELKSHLNEVVNQKRWWEFWQDAPKTRLEEWAGSAEKFGISLEDVTAAATGSDEALQRIADGLALIDGGTFEDTRQAVSRFTGDTNLANQALYDFLTEIRDEHGAVKDAATYADLFAEALGGLSTSQAEAAESVADYSRAVADALSKAGQSWEDYVADGVLNLDAYNQAIEDQAAAAIAFEENLTAASATLSEEALNYIRSLGPEAAPLLQAFIDAPLAEQTRTATNWATLGQVATDGYSSTFDVQTPTGVAIAAAQGAANSTPVTVSLQTTGDLASQVEAQVATVPQPRIYVSLEAKPVIY